MEKTDTFQSSALIYLTNVFNLLGCMTILFNELESTVNILLFSMLIAGF